MIDRYLILGLRLGKHVEGFVDSYYGPPEHREQVDGEEPLDPRSLADEAATLRELAAGLEGARGRCDINEAAATGCHVWTESQPRHVDVSLLIDL